MIVFGAFLYVLGGAALAYYFMYRFSGPRLSNLQLYFCLIVNGFFFISYMRLIERGDFVYWWHRPDLVMQYPILNWFALAGIILHAFALPIDRKLGKGNQ
ncbi:hypothetical protein AO391_25875 [Pseudomonas marginalis ICMP 9505]|uniref:Uncharacterized protein n=1 Tax=Pseudomonas kitaguniensis TaxID=2607908 RepID=A0A5N7JPS0_9PSED|nr:hypothetical protein [Pseudomonas kitaguniensis]KTC11763.1 hypothetical protein AO391_25875 [Pseudomonas marginalis ICMP 9505]MPQ83295.1 hypothetical protein [Pseudomonas kitaguniensis]